MTSRAWSQEWRPPGSVRPGWLISAFGAAWYVINIRTVAENVDFVDGTSMFTHRLLLDSAEDHGTLSFELQDHETVHVITAAYRISDVYEVTE
jgi:hypothetical protein